MVNMKGALDEFCEMIDSYGGRDKVLKALCYSAKFMAGMKMEENPVMAKKFAVFSSRVSSARATLRLIDDFPMLKHTLEYGLGRHEKDKTLLILNLIGNVVDTLYYPVEKISWLIEYKLLNVQNPSTWDTIGSVIWVLSIYLNLMRTIRNFTIMEQHKNCLEYSDNKRDDLFELLRKQRMEILTLLKISLDFTHAASTLPKGYLWGGKLQTWHVGMIGTLSAAIGIYQYFAKKKPAKK